jgi:nitrate/nitrite transporter NarK
MTRLNERSMPGVLQDILRNIQEIGRSEFCLAKSEIKEQASKAAKPAAALAMGIVLAMYALGFMLLTIVYVLTTVIAAWLAALIVTAVVAVVAVVLVVTSKERLKQVKPPEKTIETLKENVEWAKTQFK